MPFGQIFGALYFGLLCTAVGLGWLGQPGAGARVAGASFVILSLSLALGLLLRKPWARWVGVACSALMAVVGLRRAAADESVIDLVLLFASVAACLLLLLPATGRPRQAVAVPGRRRGLLEIGVALGLVGLAGSAWLAAPAGPTDAAAAEASGRGALPESAISRRIRWTDFGEGLTRASSAGQPVLVVFVTNWCGYCSKMDRTTWAAASVALRTSDLVTVRVDAEDTRERNGYTGAELAARYGVAGFPALFLLDPQGRPIARADGYLTATQLLAWLDDHLDTAPAPPRAATL